MKLVYIAHPLSAPTPEGIAANLAEAKAWVAWAARLGVVPVATWIPLAEGLLAGGVEVPEARALGLACDMAVIERCDALLVCGYRITEGMHAEIDKADRLGMPVHYIQERGHVDGAWVRILFGNQEPV